MEEFLQSGGGSFALYGLMWVIVFILLMIHIAVRREGEKDNKPQN